MPDGKVSTCDSKRDKWFAPIDFLLYCSCFHFRFHFCSIFPILFFFQIRFHFEEFRLQVEEQSSAFERLSDDYDETATSPAETFCSIFLFSFFF